MDYDKLIKDINRDFYLSPAAASIEFRLREQLGIDDDQRITNEEYARLAEYLAKTKQSLKSKIHFHDDELVVLPLIQQKASRPKPKGLIDFKPILGKDALRPAMCYALVENGYVVATDGFALVKMKYNGLDPLANGLTDVVLSEPAPETAGSFPQYARLLLKAEEQPILIEGVDVASWVGILKGADAVYSKTALQVRPIQIRFAECPQQKYFDIKNLLRVLLLFWTYGADAVDVRFHEGPDSAVLISTEYYKAIVTSLEPSVAEKYTTQPVWVNRDGSVSLKENEQPAAPKAVAPQTPITPQTPTTPVRESKPAPKLDKNKPSKKAADTLERPIQISAVINRVITEDVLYYYTEKLVEEGADVADLVDRLERELEVDDFEISVKAEADTLVDDMYEAEHWGYLQGVLIKNMEDDDIKEQAEDRGLIPTPAKAIDLNPAELHRHLCDFLETSYTITPLQAVQMLAAKLDENILVL